jgi:hypothetical protein
VTDRREQLDAADAAEWERCARRGDFGSAWQASDRILQRHRAAPDFTRPRNQQSIWQGEPVLYDVDVEVMELPFVLRATLDTIPRDPYLRAEACELPGSRPRIGLAWRVSNWEQDRAIPFDALRPLLDLEGITWCSLQQGRRPEESHRALHDVSDGDLHDAARRVTGLDLVVTADSMPAHLAGALGVPVWTLLLKHADWRWMETRSDSPWYPTMRLFRQERQGAWAGLVARVRDLLETGPVAQGFSPDPNPTVRPREGSEPPG